jgi:phage-related protein
MGLLEAVGSLISGAAGDIKGLINGVWQGVKSVYSFIVTITDLVGDAWDWMVNGLSWLGTNILDWAGVVYNLIRWIIVHGLPDAAAYVYTKAVLWAKAAVKDVERALTGLVHTVEHALSSVISDLKRYTIDAVRDVWRTLTDAWNWIEKTGKAAVNLVEHPALLVEHIIAGASEALLKWLLSQLVRLTVWVWKTTISLLGDIAPIVEDALTKVI